MECNYECNQLSKTFQKLFSAQQWYMCNNPCQSHLQSYWNCTHHLRHCYNVRGTNTCLCKVRPWTCTNSAGTCSVSCSDIWPSPEWPWVLKEGLWSLVLTGHHYPSDSHSEAGSADGEKEPNSSFVLAHVSP